MKNNQFKNILISLLNNEYEKPPVVQLQILKDKTFTDSGSYIIKDLEINLKNFNLEEYEYIQLIKWNWINKENENNIKIHVSKFKLLNDKNSKKIKKYNFKNIFELGEVKYLFDNDSFEDNSSLDSNNLLNFEEIINIPEVNPSCLKSSISRSLGKTPKKFESIVKSPFKNLNKESLEEEIKFLKKKKTIFQQKVEKISSDELFEALMLDLVDLENINISKKILKKIK